MQPTNMEKTIAIIPARGGSKRLPGKNIKLLDGIPLLAHSILYAQANPEIIHDIYVSTDNAQIKAVALQFGAKVIDRPASISGDFEPTVTALQQVIESIGFAGNVVLLQPTNPLRPADLLKEAFQIFQSGNYESLFTVTQNHHKLGKIEKEIFLPFNYEPGQRSQDLEPLYFENGLLYICRSKLIMENLIMGKVAFPMVISHPFGTVDIDTRDDFNYAEYLIKTSAE